MTQLNIGDDSALIESSVKSVGKTFKTTAFVKLMEKFEEKVSEIKEISKLHQVRGKDSEAKSIEIATACKRLNKVIDTARMSAKRPYLDFINSLDGLVRPVQKMLTEIEKAEAKKCREYALSILKAQQAAAAKPAPTIAGLKTSNVPVRPVETKVTATSGGSGSYKVEKVFKLVDITKVPAEYLVVDWVKVRKAQKDGVMSIPGMELVDDVNLRLRG